MTDEPVRADALLAISAGGVVGAEARYGLDVLVPHRPPQFPWATLLINVTGCLAIGVLMVVLLEVISAHRLVRPFLGVGVLGGYTTFSTFALDVVGLLRAHHAGLAAGYLAATVAGSALAVWIGVRCSRRLAAR